MSKRMVDLKVEAGKVTSIDGYELGGSGGSGGGNIAVTSETYENLYKGNITPQWFSGYDLKANTAYEIGDQVQVYVSARFNNKHVNSNQILVPTTVNLSVSSDRTKMQFGDVIIVLTNINIVPSSDPSTVTDQNYRFQSENYLTYTVIKAGTTGENITLPATGFDASIKCMIITLEASGASA